MSKRRRRTALQGLTHRPARRTYELAVAVGKDDEGHWTWRCTCGAQGRCHNDEGHAWNEAGLHRNQTHYGEFCPLVDATPGRSR